MEDKETPPHSRPTRCFEDLALGEFKVSPERSVTQEEIISFARTYDPQWFHCDAEAAKQSVFGEVVASGIQTLAIWRQLDHLINGDIDYVCGIGWDEMRMKRALRAGDTVHVTSEIVSLEPSPTRPERGTVIIRYAVINQNGQELVTFTGTNLVYTRAARS